MSKVDDLIKALCPEGVTSETISSICTVSRGRVMSKDYLRDNSGEYPVYSSQTAKNGVFGKIKTYDYDGEYLTWTTDGANAGSIFYRTGRFSITNVCGLLKVSAYSVNAKYLSYILGTLAKRYVSSGMGNPKLMSNVMSAIKVPIPPLKVQEEIVNILDKFTQLEAELSAELSARRKQYEYYRNQLLTFSEEGGVRWATIKEVTMATSNMKWKDTNGELYRYIDLSSVSRIDHTIGEVIEINSTDAPSRAQKIVNKNDIIFATTRPTLQRYALIDDDFAGQIASTGYCVMRAKTSEVLPKWLYFNIAKTDFNNYTEKNQEGSAYPAISDSKVKAFKIPVPPLEVQGRIVSILDKFDSLVNSISDGLPAEINSRRQQYEFYRTKLLTFQELNL
jgi:type I restriction enzyme S subunit